MVGREDPPYINDGRDSPALREPRRAEASLRNGRHSRSKNYSATIGAKTTMPSTNHQSAFHRMATAYS